MLPAHLRIGPVGTSIPGWIHVVKPDGTPSTPLGRSVAGSPGALLIDGKVWHAIDGTCELFLPQGINTIAFSRMPGWHMESFDLLVASGQLSARALPTDSTLKHSGTREIDLGCHGLSPGQAWFEGRASGLDSVQLVAHATPPEFRPSLLEFSGSDAAIDRLGCQVQINTINYGGILGNLVLLDCHRPVYPLSLEPGNEFPTWSLSDWWAQCHRKRGLVIWADDHRNNACEQGEALAGTILGKVDAFECLDLDPVRTGGLELWNDLLVCGLAPALAGSSGMRSPESFPGRIRTLIAAESMPWVTATRAGHTTISAGPSLVARLNGRAPGEGIDPACPAKLHVTWDRATWPGRDHGMVLEMIGGQGVFWRATEGASQSCHAAEIMLPADCGPHIALRARLANGTMVAQTSCFRVAGQRVTVSSTVRAAAQRLLHRLEQTRVQVQADPRHENRSGEVISCLEKAAGTLELVMTS